MARTIYEILGAGDPAAPALLAPGRKALDFAGLKAQVDSTIAALNARGIGRGDRVAIVLANGPEMASAFLSVAAGATAAPLNPAYKEEEFDFYLRDQNAKSLIVKQGDDSAAVAVASAEALRASSRSTDFIIGEAPSGAALVWMTRWRSTASL